MPDRAPVVAAIVLAGGSGTRLGLDDGRNKAYMPIGGLPLLAWSMRTLGGHAGMARLVVVVRPGDESEAASAIAVTATAVVPSLVPGGPTRTASERAGIDALRDEIAAGAIDVVLVHDAARPFVSPGLVERLVDAATTHAAAIPGLALDEATVERGPDGTIALLDLSNLRCVQTPQAFDARVLLAAFDAAGTHAEAFDTAELIAATGGPAAVVVEGDPDNLKVTRPVDVERAAQIVGRAHHQP